MLTIWGGRRSSFNLRKVLALAGGWISEGARAC